MELNFKIKDKSDKSLNIREANLSTFKKKGFPNKREEDWKFTDLEKVAIEKAAAVFANGMNKPGREFNTEAIRKIIQMKV